MRFLFVVRFQGRNGKVGRFKTTADSPKKAGQKCRSGQVLSVRKARRVA